MNKPTLSNELIPDGYVVTDFRIPTIKDSYIGYNCSDELIISDNNVYLICSGIMGMEIPNERCKGCRYILTKVDDLTYPIYLKSDKEGEKTVLAVEFFAKTVYKYYYSDGKTSTYKDVGAFTIETIMKGCGYYIISKAEFDKLTDKPRTYPVYLHSDDKRERNTAAIKFDSELEYAFYHTDGTVSGTYRDRLWTIDSLMKSYGYKIITKEEFDKLTTPPVTYPVYLKSDKWCEQEILVVKFISEKNCVYYYKTNTSTPFNNFHHTIENLMKAYDYKIISEKEFNELVTPPVTYPVYLKSDKEGEKYTAAIKFIGEKHYIFYFKNGKTQEYVSGYYGVSETMQHYGYYIITKEEFDKLTTPPVTYPVYLKSNKEGEQKILAVKYLGETHYIYYNEDGKKDEYLTGCFTIAERKEKYGYYVISEKEFNDLVNPVTPVNLNNTIIQIQGVSYKLTKI